MKTENRISINNIKNKSISPQGQFNPPRSITTSTSTNSVISMLEDEVDTVVWLCTLTKVNFVCVCEWTYLREGSRLMQRALLCFWVQLYTGSSAWLCLPLIGQMVKEGYTGGSQCLSFLWWTQSSWEEIILSFWTRSILHWDWFETRAYFLSRGGTDM